ncbi:MAG TPA: response regulator, partial [Kofleriaceae bacterium]
MTGPWRIVVIDDNPDDRAEVRRLLLQGSSRRYTFSEAGTAALGVRAVLDLPEGPPHCVVLDYYLPDANAPQVLEALTGADRLTLCPVVVLTGGSSHDLGAAVLRAGAQDYVGKAWLQAESLTRAI